MITRKTSTWVVIPRGGASRRSVHPIVVVLFAANLTLGQSVGPGYDIELSRQIPMRDGVELEAWLTKPAPSTEKIPTVLTLTQYEIDGSVNGHNHTISFVKRGYAVVQAYVRGRGLSGGEKSDNLGLQVGRDGYDLVEWIAKQPWSDGRVVMYGASYVGMTQWRTAAQHPPHLAAIAPYVPIYPGWDVPNTNGIPQSFTTFILGYTAGRSLNVGFGENSAYLAGKLLEQYAGYRPFTELSGAVGIAPDDWWMLDEKGERKPMMTVWLDHVGNEAFNLAAAPRQADFAAMNIPVLSATGFFDDDQPGALRYYHSHLANAPAAAASNHYLIIGPWDHGGTNRPSKQIEGLTIPDASVIDMDALRADWYDWVLGRGPRPTLLHDRVSYFMLGADEWRYAHTLEAASSGRALTFFLAEHQGTPGNAVHPGRLTQERPRLEPPASLLSDPRELPELELAKSAEDEDLTSHFRDYQKRAVVFQSDALTQALEVAGHMQLRLTLQADVPDFDLWAQVLMVQPDGSTMRLGEDIRRARFRNSPFKEELLKPQESVDIPFEFWWMARRIPAGSRLRVTIAPLNSPNFQKNFNTGGRVGYEKIEEARIAHIKVFHDAKRASRLILPLAASPSAP